MLSSASASFERPPVGLGEKEKFPLDLMSSDQRKILFKRNKLRHAIDVYFPGLRVQVTLSDDGPGNEYVAHIFDGTKRVLTLRNETQEGLVDQARTQAEAA